MKKITYVFVEEYMPFDLLLHMSTKTLHPKQYLLDRKF